MTAVQDGLVYFVFVALGLVGLFWFLAAAFSKSASDADDALGYDEDGER